MAASTPDTVNPVADQAEINEVPCITTFKDAGREIVTGNMIPPDFATFWSQSAQQGFNPKIVTIGKALLFPSVIDSLGNRGNGLSSEVWWSQQHPFSSSLTGDTAKELADGYSGATNRPWTQPIGFKHALFEVVADVIKRLRTLHFPSMTGPHLLYSL